MITADQIEDLKKLPPLMGRRYTIFYQLPKEVQEVIISTKTAEKNEEIAKKHRLSDDATWQMSYVVGMVLLGETNIVDFVKSLQEKCKLNEEPARQLARDINSEIFLPIKESLKKIHKIPEWPREDRASRPSTQLTRQPTAPESSQRTVVLEEKPKDFKNIGNVVNLKELKEE